MTNHAGTPIELTEAAQSDAALVASLLDDYLRELGNHREVPIGATDAASYRQLDAYWSEPGRHAFLIRCNHSVVGFAFIRDPISTGTAVHQVAEFYIAPQSRRRGLGRQAIRAIWARFPGQWELQVHCRNSAAIQFWTSCAQAEASAAPKMRTVQASDGRRAQLNFRVEACRSTRQADGGQQEAREPQDSPGGLAK
jgi:predicted acetyltransferase